MGLNQDREHALFTGRTMLHHQLHCGLSMDSIASKMESSCSWWYRWMLQKKNFLHASGKGRHCHETVYESCSEQVGQKLTDLQNINLWSRVARVLILM